MICNADLVVCRLVVVTVYVLFDVVWHSFNMWSSQIFIMFIILL